MNVKYEFINGEIIEIELTGELVEVVIKLDKEEFNSNRRETRRHVSVNDMFEKGIQLQDDSVNVLSEVERNEVNEKLYWAIEQLLPQQKCLLQKVYFEEMSIVDISRREGVSEAAIRNRLNKIYKKLEKIIK